MMLNLFGMDKNIISIFSGIGRNEMSWECKRVRWENKETGSYIVIDIQINETSLLQLDFRCDLRKRKSWWALPKTVSKNGAEANMNDFYFVDNQDFNGH